MVGILPFQAAFSSSVWVEHRIVRLLPGLGIWHNNAKQNRFVFKNHTAALPQPKPYSLGNKQSRPPAPLFPYSHTRRNKVIREVGHGGYLVTKGIRFVTKNIVNLLYDFGHYTGNGDKSPFCSLTRNTLNFAEQHGNTNPRYSAKFRVFRVKKSNSFPFVV